MTVRIQDAVYVSDLAQYPFLVASGTGFGCEVYAGQPPVSFARHISAAYLAHGDCVLVKPSTYNPVEWSLADFRERLGLHSAGIVKVES
jgi:hypothetical protein